MVNLLNADPVEAGFTEPPNDPFEKQHSSALLGNESIVLSVNNVSKKFCRDLKQSLFYGVQDILSELSAVRGGDNSRLRKKEFWALQNISFDLKKGEAIALVGRNGSGKSTLLRMISGLIKPDTGSIAVRGRIAPLIALGAGFNPVLTGRENIYANMSVLGLSKQQIDQRFDAVVGFSEIESAIDSPVQSYSSGMAARLGFACAVYTEPDILVIDEVLSVGDVQFRAKCFRRLGELRKQGVSFILVSHNSNSVRTLCESAVYLADGRVKAWGETTEVVRNYEADVLNLNLEETSKELILPAKSKAESLGVDIRLISFQDDKGRPLKAIYSGESARLCVRCQAHEPIDNLYFAVSIDGKDSNGDRIVYMNNYVDETVLALAAGDNLIEMVMPCVNLIPGPYAVNVLVSRGALEMMDAVEGFSFNVESKVSLYKCKFYQPRDWKASVL